MGAEGGTEGELVREAGAGGRGREMGNPSEEGRGGAPRDLASIVAGGGGEEPILSVCRGGAATGVGAGALATGSNMSTEEFEAWKPKVDLAGGAAMTGMLMGLEAGVGVTAGGFPIEASNIDSWCIKSLEVIATLATLGLGGEDAIGFGGDEAMGLGGEEAIVFGGKEAIGFGGDEGGEEEIILEESSGFVGISTGFDNGAAGFAGIVTGFAGMSVGFGGKSPGLTAMLIGLGGTLTGFGGRPPGPPGPATMLIGLRGTFAGFGGMAAGAGLGGRIPGAGLGGRASTAGVVSVGSCTGRFGSAAFVPSLFTKIGGGLGAGDSSREACETGVEWR